MMSLNQILPLQQLLLGVIIILAAIFVAAAEPNSGCVTTCGSLDIPYPFGTSHGCYLDPSFLITCNSSSGTPTPFLNKTEVRNISLDGELRVSAPVARDCPYESGYNHNNSYAILDQQIFPMSSTKNKFTTIGCDTVGVIESISTSKKNYTSGCVSLCDSIDSVVNGSCSGAGCCLTSLPQGLYNFVTALASLYNRSRVFNFSPCGFGFVVEEQAYNFSSLDFQKLQDKDVNVPLVLDWAVGNQTCEDAKKNTTAYACKAANSECHNSTNGPGYRCFCSLGYDGNPYLSNGCKDIDECKTSNPCIENACINHVGYFNCSCPDGYDGDGRRNGIGCIRKPSNSRTLVITLCICIGLLVLLLGGCSILLGSRRRKLTRLKEKFFQQNGGLMLQRQISNRGKSMETTKIFSADELKKATNNYEESKILGKGGYGTVYKGLLPDNKVVAIKKSKICDQNQIEQFINEVIVLTQVNHRNVVKLLGCCLETEVPLLVYEFITNGTLSEHLHNESRASSLSLEKRLKIATETARALAYLHAEISMPIIHRDVKSTNILLDDNHTAKVADFGASRLVSLDQTQITTLVQGTLGYLDPEYFHSSQLTEKSDVYSFGVVLAELLTGEKAVSSFRSENDKNLAMYFVSAVKEDRLLQILESHIVNEDNIVVLKEVAHLTTRCLRVRGEDRPTMTEVAMELEGLRTIKKHLWGKDNQVEEEMVSLLSAPTQSFSIDIGMIGSTNATIGQDSMRNHVLKPLDDGR